MKTNNIDNVDNLEVNTINDIPFNLLSQNLESVLTVGNNAGNKEIINLQKITFNKNEFNQVYEDTSANLIIQSPNDIDLSANEINCNCDIDMSNNGIKKIKSVSFNFDSSNKIYEKDITKNLIINSPYDIDLSGNNINLNFNEFKLNNLGSGKMIFKNNIKIYDLGFNYIKSINSVSGGLTLDPNMSVSDKDDDRLEIYGLNIF
jgi:hypothetical protein